MVKCTFGQVHVDVLYVIECRIVEITVHHGNVIQCSVAPVGLGKCAIVKDGVGVGRDGIQCRLGEIRKIVCVLPQNCRDEADLVQRRNAETDIEHVGVVKVALNDRCIVESRFPKVGDVGPFIDE